MQPNFSPPFRCEGYFVVDRDGKRVCLAGHENRKSNGRQIAESIVKALNAFYGGEYPSEPEPDEEPEVEVTQGSQVEPVQEPEDSEYVAPSDPEVEESFQTYKKPKYFKKT